jgi:hypothetical protein
MRRGNKPPVGPSVNGVYYTRNSKPMLVKACCLTCEDKHAKHLQTGHCHDDVGCFCSLKCAAAWAVFKCSQLGLQWCTGCNDWFKKEEGCGTCRMRQREKEERERGQQTLFPETKSDASSL